MDIDARIAELEKRCMELYIALIKSEYAFMGVNRASGEGIPICEKETGVRERLEQLSDDIAQNRRNMMTCYEELREMSIPKGSDFEPEVIVCRVVRNYGIVEMELEGSAKVEYSLGGFRFADKQAESFFMDRAKEACAEFNELCRNGDIHDGIRNIIRFRILRVLYSMRENKMIVL